MAFSIVQERQIHQQADKQERKMCRCFHMCRSNWQEDIPRVVKYLKEQTQEEQKPKIPGWQSGRPGSVEKKQNNIFEQCVL